MDLTPEQIQEIVTALTAKVVPVLQTQLEARVKTTLDEKLQGIVTTEQLSTLVTTIQNDVKTSLENTNSTVNKIIESMDEKIKKLTETPKTTWKDWFAFDK